MNVPKKIIGIITLHGYENYGNKLQNYALQEVIKSLGFSAQTIVIRDKGTHEKKHLKKIKIAMKMSLKKVYNNISIKINRKYFITLTGN